MTSILNYSPLHFMDFESYHISHDGEPDDIQAVNIASNALRGKPVTVDCVIGNQEIKHVPGGNKDEEMKARMRLTNEVFNAQVAIPGALHNEQVSENYVNEILHQSLSKKCLVLHTDSFKSLHELFNKAQPGQLKNVVILTYGSVNLTWAMPKAENYQSFYDSLSASGAKLVLVEGFPFLDTRNKLTHKNTPLSYALLSHLDGPAGEKWTTLNVATAEKVRAKHAFKVAEYICKAANQASAEQQMQLMDHVSQIAHLFGHTMSTEALSDPALLHQILNQSIVGEAHDRLESKIKELSKLLLTILNEKEADLNRPFNIYAGTTLRGQALIADQIPAIIFSELIEKRNHGIARYCLPVTFDGLVGSRFAKYALSTVKSSLFYLDTELRIRETSSDLQKDQLIDSYLKYIDLSMATAFLVNDQMITPATRKMLLSSSFKTQMKELIETVTNLGYDLPVNCRELIS